MAAPLLPQGEEPEPAALPPPPLPPPTSPPAWRSRPPRLSGEPALPTATAGLTPLSARSMIVGQVSGADGRLPIRLRCGRVYD